MSTRSRIAILNSDGSVDSIYCHYDGYLSHNGVILAKYYNNEEKIRKLISLGSLSFLGKSAEFFQTSNYPFESSENNITIAHHRDLGDELIVEKYSSFDEWMLNINFEDYHYIWKNGEWFVAHSGNMKFEKLADTIKTGFG